MAVQLLPAQSTGSIDLHEIEDERLALYSATGALVGRIAPASWEIGDLDTPGLRATLDPAGGLRFRSTTSQLLNLVDQQGMSIRDEASGLVVTDLSRDKLRLADPSGGNEIVLSTVQVTTLATPRYTGVTEAAPSSTIVAPAAALLTTNDLELSHAAAFKRATVQAATWTPPAGWTEVIDNDYGLASTLAASLASRGVATGTAGTFTSSQTNWDLGAGTHIIIRGTPGTATPTVRSTTQLEATTSGGAATLVMSAPAGLVAGDVLLAFISMGNSGGSVPVGWVTPTGWVYLGAQVTLTGSGSTMSMLAVGVWAKLCGPSEPSTYSTTINFGVGTKTMHATLVAVQGSTSTPAGQQFNIGGYNLAGAWRSYTPVNVGVTKGSGTIDGDYLLMGKTCFFRWGMLWAAGSAFSGNIKIGLPFLSASTAGGHIAQSAPGYATDVSAAVPIMISARILGSVTDANVIHDLGGGANFNLVTNNQPFIWAAGDSLGVSGVYEIA